RVRVETATQGVLEALDVVSRGLLELRERVRILVRAIAVELVELADDLIQLLAVDLLLTEKPAQLFGVLRALTRLGAELANLLAGHRANAGPDVAAGLRTPHLSGHVARIAAIVTLAVASALRLVALIAAPISGLALALTLLRL